MIYFLVFMILGIINPVFAQSSKAALQSTAVSIPGGQGGIGFDDMTYSSDLHKVIIPAGHTGRLYLIDPASFSMRAIGGFSSAAKYEKGHDIGITSADEGEGFLFVLDHGRNVLAAVDLKSSKIVATVDLAGDSDYVRYVGINHEIWVTEPHDKQIEIFKFFADHPALSVIKRITVEKGPESLVIDHLLGKVYTNLGPMAAAIDLQSYAIAEAWPNTCVKSRGDAIDEQKGFLFVSCGEGKAIVFDLNHNNKKLGELVTDPGVDVISYNAKLAHLYFTSGKNATLSVLGVSATGGLALLAEAPAAKRSHCVVSDDQNNIWVCDPTGGRLLRYKDAL